MKKILRATMVLASLAGPIISMTMPVEAKLAIVKLDSDQLSAVKRINAYLNSFRSLKSEFIQINPRGGAMRGIVMISKPGNMRFEYAPPSPLLIIADGKWLTIKNKVKERGDQFPLSATPLRLVVANNVDLLAETDIVGFEQSEGLTSVSLQDRKSKLGGFITLVYDETAKQLQQWIVTDGKGRKTSVELANIETGMKFDPKLFIGKINREASKN